LSSSTSSSRSRDPDQLAAALERQRDAGRVLERRHRVDELRDPALAVEALELGLQQVDPHAVLVELDLHDVGLVGDEDRDRARIRGRLGHYDVARVDQRLAHEVDHLLPAGRDEQLVGLDVHPLGGHHRGDALLDVLGALRRPVLERARRRVDRHARHQRGEVLGRERRGVRQPSRQRDDLRARGDRHQIAHGGGLHDARAGSEQTGVALQVAR
jgi:hypothetical protein